MYRVPFDKGELTFSLPPGMTVAVAESRVIPPVEDLPAAVLERYLAPEEEPGFEVHGRRFLDPEEALSWRRAYTEAGRVPSEDEDLIRVGGRDFPNTPEGVRQALSWQQQLSAAGRAPRVGHLEIVHP